MLWKIQEDYEMENDKMVLSVKELQECLGIGRDVAYALMKNGAFPSMRLGNRYMVEKEAFARRLKQNEGRLIKL